ncbi:hypothetical protein ACG1BZ_11875 [Microbulbifer sp. CNSA002]|uniref:hypothetical protein n=1 Tax=unclassified Microbulbifer TaxID=2619833 RepID=UPI0039B6BC3B
MDFNTTTPSLSNIKTTQNWRFAVSVLIAIGTHIALIVVPVSIAPGPTPRTNTSLEVKLLAPFTPLPSTSPPTAEEPSVVSEQDTAPTDVVTVTSPPIPDSLNNVKPTKIEEPPPKLEGALEARPHSEDFPIAPRSGRQPTVFNPVLERKIARERNKVRRYQPTENRYQTSTGTFVQVGDRCFDVKELPATNTDSDLNPWFGAKCPDNSRSQAEIDRLAEKYGIP